MAIATSFTECRNFAQQVTSLGGTLPKQLQGLLSGWAVLNAPVGSQRQADPIIDACLAGELTSERLQELLPAAAAAAQANEYRARLGNEIERTLTGEFHRALKAGGCDTILDSLRPKWTEHAEAIAAARDLINPESDLEHIVMTGRPELITAWQTLGSHIAVVAKIGTLASQFGSKPTCSFPQIQPYNLADDFRIDDRAVMCADGNNLAVDSAPFMTPDPIGHRTSPWFKVPLKLHSIESARARYNAWAATEFDRHYDRPQGGRLINGEVVYDKKPENPYRRESANI